jgi:hypothetical protein
MKKLAMTILLACGLASPASAQSNGGYAAGFFGGGGFGRVVLPPCGVPVKVRKPDGRLMFVCSREVQPGWVVLGT